MTCHFRKVLTLIDIKMNENIGIDKEITLKKSNRIREAWNEFFWESRVCQRHIRFTAEEKSNYIGDLLNYFDDTLHHLETFRVQPDYLSSLYETTAVLQMMFIQQDMVDEMLGVVKLGKSSSNEKKFVRSLRNELIGHPISRGENGELVHSVFITGQTEGSVLSFIRYHKSNNYKYDLVTYNWRDIFAKHEAYLNQYLDAILERIIEILNQYSQTLLTLKSSAGHVSFEKLVRWVSLVFDIYTTNFPLFDPQNLLSFYNKREAHPRYKYALGLFQDGLGDRIGEVLRDIRLISLDNSSFDYDPLITFNPSFLQEFENTEIASANRKINYEFSKLFERDHLFGIDYFKREFHDDIEVMQELENMALQNGERNGEFHCSFEYLRCIFVKRGML